jgi:DHA1 family bicyclomycin/chloramphenicol resistance-like MFS transporter
LSNSGTVRAVPPVADLPRRSWLFWLTAVACLPPMGLNVVVPLDAALGSDLGLSASAVQATVALYTLGLAVGQPLAGIAADRWGRRPTLLTGLLLGLFGGLVAALARDAATLLCGRLLTGLGLSVVLVVPRATLRDLYTGGGLQRGMAIISGAFALTPAAVPIIGWLLLSVGGWRTALALVPVLVAAGLAVALWRHTETRPGDTSVPDLAGLAALWKERRPRQVALAFAAIGSIFFLLIAQGPAAVRASVAMDAGEIAVLMGGTYLGFLLGNIVAAAQAGRVSGLRVCAWGLALCCSGVALIAVCVWAPSMLLWVGALLLYSIGHGLIFPAAMGVVMQAMPSRAGMAAALTGMLQMLAGAAVSGLAAFLPGGPTSRTAVVAGTMAALSVIALVAAHRENA